MVTYWCVNFNHEEVLKHGLTYNLWAMQYQYSHYGYVYQGDKRQIARISTNWKAAGNVKPSDWIVAYLKGQRFFAVGEVVPPRKQATHPPDTVERTLTEHKHLFLDGIVHYTGAFYEDFTDSWRCPNKAPKPDQPNQWVYPQRLDVREWENKVESGVIVRGMSKYVTPVERRKAVFGIDKEYFDLIQASLKSKSHEVPKYFASTGKTHQGQDYSQPDQEDEQFDPENHKDDRERTRQEIALRRGQSTFRNKLLHDFRGCCLLTECDAESALEAAHIVRFLGAHSDSRYNGLLLRADIHTLFDSFLICIRPDTLKVVLAPPLRETQYDKLDGKDLSKVTVLHDRIEALKQKWAEFVAKMGLGSEEN